MFSGSQIPQLIILMLGVICGRYVLLHVALRALLPEYKRALETPEKRRFQASWTIGFLLGWSRFFFILMLLPLWGSLLQIAILSYSNPAELPNLNLYLLISYAAIGVILAIIDRIAMRKIYGSYAIPQNWRAHFK